MSTPTTIRQSTTTWVQVCTLDDLPVERGCAALIGGAQVALFRTALGDVHAVQQRDPYSGANVMSRGIIGNRRHIPTIASPMYKQVFDLRTGECLDPVGYEPVDGCGELRVWDVLVSDGDVLVTTAPMEPLPRLRNSA